MIVQLNIKYDSITVKTFMNKLKIDGRKLRSESTSDHILNTAIKIVRKGDIDISFDSIAKEAKIGTRTIFRHFKDQESLLESLDKKLAHEFKTSFSSINSKDDIEARIKNLSAVLIKLYKENQNILRWTLKNVWRDKTLRKNMFSWNQILKDFVYSILPEIQDKTKPEREIIFECISFIFFLRLNVIQGLNDKQINEIFILNTRKYLT